MVEIELTELYEYEKKKIAIMLIAETLNDLEKKDITNKILKTIK